MNPLTLAAVTGAALALVARHVGRPKPIVICPRFAASSGGGCVPLERVEREWAQTRDLELAHVLVREYTRRGDRAQQLRVVGEMIDAGDDQIGIDRFAEHAEFGTPKGFIDESHSHRRGRGREAPWHASTGVELRWRTEDGVEWWRLAEADFAAHVIPLIDDDPVLSSLAKAAVHAARAHAASPSPRTIAVRDLAWNDIERLIHSRLIGQGRNWAVAEAAQFAVAPLTGRERSWSQAAAWARNAAHWSAQPPEGGERPGAEEQAKRDRELAWQARRLVDWWTGRRSPGETAP